MNVQLNCVLQHHYTHYIAETLTASQGLIRVTCILYSPATEDIFSPFFYYLWNILYSPCHNNADFHTITLAVWNWPTLYSNTLLEHWGSWKITIFRFSSTLFELVKEGNWMTYYKPMTCRNVNYFARTNSSWPVLAIST